MVPRRYPSLTVILITISLDILCVFVVVVTALAGDSKTSRYDNYDLDKGPVFYEAYYPDARNVYQEKRYYDRSTILERSFQVPSDHFSYSSLSANRAISDDGQSNIADKRHLSEEQQKIVELRRDYETANRFLPSRDQRSTIVEDDTKLQTTRMEEIFKLIRRAISQDLNNWNTLEKYFNRSLNQNQLLPPQAAVYSKESRKDKKDGSYAFQENWIDLDLSKRPSNEALRNLKARDAKQRPTYFEEIDAGRDTMTKRTSISDMRATDKPIKVVSDSLTLENIFQPRPQLIKYKFFKKPMTRVDERDEKIIDNSMAWNYDDKLVPEQVKDKSHGKLIEENVKVTSIQVSELPRHKTRHHHGEWPKRDYFAYRHRSSAGFKIA